MVADVCQEVAPVESRDDRAGDDEQDEHREDALAVEMEELQAGAEPDEPGDGEQPQRLGEQVASVGQGAEEEQAERQHRQRHDLDGQQPGDDAGTDC